VVPVHRLIWRDWNRRVDGNDTKPPTGDPGSPTGDATSPVVEAGVAPVS